jgi:hypothetical protein
MKKIGIIFLFFLLFDIYSFASSLDNKEELYIDWIDGRIYSSTTITSKMDYTFIKNSLAKINDAKERAKINYYSILKKINMRDSMSVVDYIELSSEKSRELFSLIDSAKLETIRYPSVNSIEIVYYIDMYGDNSIMDIIMKGQKIYTEELKGYMGYSYNNNYTGIIIDARGDLSSFNERIIVKIKPSIFLAIKDNEGNLVFNEYNVLPEVIKNRGMVKYSYNIYEDNIDRVGKNPLRIVAYGAADEDGSILIVAQNDAKKMLASNQSRDAIKNGKVVVVIDK